MSAEPKQRFVALDSWRGICAVLVAMFHLSILGHIYYAPLVRHAFLFVDFFFVLSGFVITYAYAGELSTASNLRVFAIRRLGRVWPLHIVVLGAFVFAETVNLVLMHATGLRTGRPPFDPAGMRPLADIPADLFLVHSFGITNGLSWNFPSWSISAELWTYLVFGFVCVVFQSYRTLAFATVGLTAAIVVEKFSSSGINVNYELGFFRCLFGFATGHIIQRIYSSSNVFKTGTTAEICAVLIVFWFVWNAGEGPFSIFAPIVFGIAVWVFAFESGAVSRFLKGAIFQHLGKISYSIYMVQAFVVSMGFLAVTVLQRMTGHTMLMDMGPPGAVYRVITNVNPYLLDGLVVIYVGAIVALATFTYHYVERPGQRLFARLSRYDWRAGRTGVTATIPDPVHRGRE
jgi:peptidoglycan/LPS O-acetylase OafA/YrhL